MSLELAGGFQYFGSAPGGEGGGGGSYLPLSGGAMSGSIVLNSPYWLSNSSGDGLRLDSGNPTLLVGNLVKMSLTASNLALALGVGLQFNTGATLRSEFPNALDLHGGATSQELNVYNYFTDTANLERIRLAWASNIAYLLVEKFGAGSSNPLHVVIDNAVQAQFTSQGVLTRHLLPISSESYDLGDASSRFRDGYFSGEVYASNVPRPLFRDNVDRAGADGMYGGCSTYNVPADTLANDGDALFIRGVAIIGSTNFMYGSSYRLLLNGAVLFDTSDQSDMTEDGGGQPTAYWVKVVRTSATTARVMGQLMVATATTNNVINKPIFAEVAVTWSASVPVVTEGAGDGSPNDVVQKLFEVHFAPAA